MKTIAAVIAAFFIAMGFVAVAVTASMISDLAQQLTSTIEAVLQVKSEQLSLDGDRATAQVDVQGSARRKHSLHLALARVNGLWKVDQYNSGFKMNAEPLLTKIAKTLQDCRLEVILVGNAAAALQGAPVTTLDFVMFRKTPLNLKKVKKVAELLDMSATQPYYPASDLYRLVQKKTGFQLDFMSRLHGVKSFDSLKSRATEVYFGAAPLLVADLKDIIRSKRTLGRPKDLAVLDILEKTQDEKEKSKE